MQNSQEMHITTLSLPKGGGAISGLGEGLNAAGPDGMATLSLPLPISAGRGVAPPLALNYSSGGGNGSFGIGWQLGLMTISRRTQHGVPRYDDNDTFISPEGEVLLVGLEETSRVSIDGIDYRVARYQPRIVNNFSKIEHYQPDAKNDRAFPFWIISTPDGQRHILGKTAQARIGNPQDPQQIAQWLLEETVTLSGEHIYYEYRAEDDAGCDEREKNAHPVATGQRYLEKVYYGNVISHPDFFLLDNILLEPEHWLFYLLLDYGEREKSIYVVPTWNAATKTWPFRADAFSHYHYGFDLRTRRLCHQVFMFHRVEALQTGNTHKDETAELVGRLILDYDEDASMATLVAVRQLGHEPDTAPVSNPPLEFDYQRFCAKSLPTWHKMDALKNFSARQRYQLVDLRGEGIPGVLYQEKGAWWYQAAQRQAGADSNAVTYANREPLPHIPSLLDNASLMDINGDGQIDWVITRPGMQGYHSLQPDGVWTHFTPINALPNEYFHPQAQLADLIGDGLSDLVLLGPKSVRLYAKQQDGWSKGQEVFQSGGITLPIPGADSGKLVAFSDMLGSGQQHLVEISARGVKCWPNLGHGRFGAMLAIPGFSQPSISFNPDQVYLADIDGSGTTDLIYALSDVLLIYLNQSGNNFAEPMTLALPDGVRFDGTCQLQIADIQGLGVASLILSVPHMAPHHWRCDLALHKPWLLNAMNNNRGSHHTLHYRSSAQFWLDEKSPILRAGKNPVSYLPFPMHLLWRTEVLDEISGNKLVAETQYYHGVWDGKEREFRGFGRVEQTDTHDLANGTAAERSAPSLSRRWFATGLEAVDSQLPTEFWQEDDQAFVGFTTRYTHWDTTQQDIPFIPEENARYWLTRAMKGQLLRSELYRLTGTELSVPYTVSEHRYQVRCLTAITNNPPAVWVTSLETRLYHYEGIAEDPQCSQHVQLRLDAFGQPLQSVDINYPRRAKPAVNPYPATLPATLFDSSYDPQQQLLRLQLQTYSWHHYRDVTWLLGLPAAQRSDAFSYASETVPADGFSQDTLRALLDTRQPSFDKTARVFLGQQQIFYTADLTEIQTSDFIPKNLVAFTENAMLDQSSLTAFDGVIEPSELVATLIQYGYQQVLQLFSDDQNNLGVFDPTETLSIWVARQGYTDYGSAEQFYRPIAQRNTLLTGETTLTWDAHHCVITATCDAAGLMTQAEYDYRFLTPVRVIDSNANQHAVTLNALGQVITSRFWGTEYGEKAGYTPLEEKPFTPPPTIDAVLSLAPGIPVAQCIILIADSWMPRLSADQIMQQMRDRGALWATLRTAHVVTEDGRVCALARNRWLRQQHEIPAVLLALLTRISRLPPHALMITTDRYDNDPQQQLRQAVIFSDGFGRILQTATRHEAGDAWLRAEKGGLVVDAAGALVASHTTTRWAISGRVEYDNKGQLVRAYQPYFLNDWQYVSDDSARGDLFADTHLYDPLGRECKVITAKGFLRESQYYPWFVVSEDENDTASRIGE